MVRRKSVKSKRTVKASVQKVSGRPVGKSMAKPCGDCKPGIIATVMSWVGIKECDCKNCN